MKDKRLDCTNLRRNLSEYKQCDYVNIIVKKCFVNNYFILYFWKTKNREKISIHINENIFFLTNDWGVFYVLGQKKSYWAKVLYNLKINFSFEVICTSSCLVRIIIFKWPPSCVCVSISLVAKNLLPKFHNDW